MDTVADETRTHAPAQPAEQDWLTALKELTDGLAELERLPLLAHDPVARSIFRDLPFAPDMDEIARQCDLLVARVNELLADPQSSGVIETRPAPRKRTMLRL